MSVTLTPLHYFALGLGGLSVLFLLSSVMSLRRRHFGQVATHLAMALCFLLIGGIFGLGALSIQGYQALTLEQLAATVTVEPIGENQFKADFVLPSGETKTFTLSGNQLLVDAHILKWKPIANILGYHTSYELARISGRYLDLADEQTKPHTVFGLSDEKIVDLFELRKKFAQLNVLLDTEYGSASFVPAQYKQQYALMVSTTGLLFRRIEP